MEVPWAGMRADGPCAGPWGWVGHEISGGKEDMKGMGEGITKGKRQ